MPTFTFTESPQVADSRLMHSSITARCGKATLNGKNRPTAEVEVRALNVGYADIPDVSERRGR